MAAALMLVARIGLMRLNLPHYEGVELSGHAGLLTLGKCLGFGAAFGIIYGFLIRSILPSGAPLAALIFSIVPFVVFSMALPMWQGGSMISDTWYLLYLELHWFIFSLALVFLGKGGGGGKSSKE